MPRGKGIKQDFVKSGENAVIPKAVQTPLTGDDAPSTTDQGCDFVKAGENPRPH